MMKRSFIPLSFIGVIAISTPLQVGADFSYHAEIPKDSKISTDYLEKRKHWERRALMPNHGNVNWTKRKRERTLRRRGMKRKNS